MFMQGLDGADLLLLFTVAVVGFYIIKKGN